MSNVGCLRSCVGVLAVEVIDVVVVVGVCTDYAVGHVLLDKISQEVRASLSRAKTSIKLGPYDSRDGPHSVHQRETSDIIVKIDCI